MTTARSGSNAPPAQDSSSRAIRLRIDDPDVREADARWDRATPSTHRNLVHARLAAQARAGIAPEDRAPLHSAQVEEYRACRGVGGAADGSMIGHWSCLNFSESTGGFYTQRGSRLSTV
jgi:hypothetical protein